MNEAPSSALPKRPTSFEELGEAVRAASAVGGKEGVQVRIDGSASMPLTRFASAQPVQTISTLRMNKLVEHAAADMTVIIQAGITLEALQKQLAWQNQWLPVDPPAVGGRSPGQRTIGGLIATNSLGPLRFSYGDWRFLIMGMRWVDAAGRLIKGGGRTVKNVAGYSSPRMMIGSCGSLGVIAEVTLRTFARPADEQCVIIYCRTATEAEDLLAAVLISPTTPGYVQAVGGRTFTGNSLGLPAADGLAIIIGFLGRPEVCAAQVDLIRGLAATRNLENIAQTAAQAGRLRLWMTSEPPVQGNGLGFRIFTASSQVCALLLELDQADVWAVSEAATGVIRGVAPAADVGAKVQQLAASLNARLLPTAGASPDRPPPSDDIYRRIKPALDPDRLFGDPAS